MHIFGAIIQKTSWGNWLFLCLLFGALAFLFRIIPIKELPWRRSSGGYTSSYTFRRAVHFGSYCAFSVSQLCLLGLIGAITGLWRNKALVEVFGVFFLACLLLLVIPLYRKSSSYLKGTEGEGLVERELKKLSPDFFVFHDFPTGRGNIDHLVIGPTGVFAIETKNWKTHSPRGGKEWVASFRHRDQELEGEAIFQRGEIFPGEFSKDKLVQTGFRRSNFRQQFFEVQGAKFFRFPGIVPGRKGKPVIPGAFEECGNSGPCQFDRVPIFEEFPPENRPN